MPDKTWITSGEAASLMSEVNKRPISVDYVRLLGRKGLIKMRELDGRTKLYSRSDCARYIVAIKPKTRATRARKSEENVA